MCTRKIKRNLKMYIRNFEAQFYEKSQIDANLIC